MSDRTRLLEGTRALDWLPRDINDGSVPSIWFVARASKSESPYHFLYHPTHRYVQFSAVELARRGWGCPGRLEVNSGSVPS